MIQKSKTYLQKRNEEDGSKKKKLMVTKGESRGRDTLGVWD